MIEKRGDVHPVFFAKIRCFVHSLTLMKAGWRIGSLFGIPLFLDPSWFFIFGLVTLIYGSEGQSYGVTDGLEWIIGFCMALLLVFSALLHELGHSLVARSQGIRVHSITLFLFGGIASIEKESKTPIQALQVAIAGPAVSFGLFLAFTLMNRIPNLDAGLTFILSRLASINLILSLFNMMPGLPLDGGQVLKALIWNATGNRLQGFRWAARSGQIFGWVAICLGILLYLNSFEPMLLWLAIIGWFGVSHAKGYVRMADIQTIMRNLTATDVMRREFRVVDATLSVQAFIQQHLQDSTPANDVHRQSHSSYFAASHGRYRGYIDINQLTKIERNKWESLTLSNVAVPLGDMPFVQESASLVDVIHKLEQHQHPELTVLSPADAVAGVIAQIDVVQRIMQDLNLVLPSEGLEAIAQSQNYPPELPLVQLARTLMDDEQRSSQTNPNDDGDYFQTAKK